MRKIIAVLLLLGFVSPVWAATQEDKSERGTATVYAQKLVGHRTTSGERLDREHLTAAHRSLPLGTIIEVTNRENGRKAMVRINDRGPHRRHALIDLSPASASALGIGRRGSAPVELRVAEGSP
jgi:rare lipoprotein A